MAAHHAGGAHTPAATQQQQLQRPVLQAQLGVQGGQQAPRPAHAGRPGSMHAPLGGLLPLHRPAGAGANNNRGRTSSAGGMQPLQPGQYKITQAPPAAPQQAPPAAPQQPQRQQAQQPHRQQPQQPQQQAMPGRGGGAEQGTVPASALLQRVRTEQRMDPAAALLLRAGRYDAWAGQLEPEEQHPWPFRQQPPQPKQDPAKREQLRDQAFLHMMSATQQQRQLHQRRLAQQLEHEQRQAQAQQQQHLQFLLQGHHEPMLPQQQAQTQQVRYLPTAEEIQQPFSGGQRISMQRDSGQPPLAAGPGSAGAAAGGFHPLMLPAYRAPAQVKTGPARQ
jgi:hypothetical protein